jgi:hypothetical protein
MEKPPAIGCYGRRNDRMPVLEHDARDESLDDLDADDAVLNLLRRYEGKAEGIARRRIFRGDRIGDAVKFGKAYPCADKIA